MERAGAPGVCGASEAQAPSLRATAGRYELAAAALAGYAGVLDEVGPRLAGTRRLLQHRHDELTTRSTVLVGASPAGAAGPLPAGGAGSFPPGWFGALPVSFSGVPDPGAELLPLARRFQADYDRWADALDRCAAALRQDGLTYPTRHAHGLRVFGHRLADAAGNVLDPLERVVRHPTLSNISTCLGELNTGLTVLGLGLLFLCPPVATACLLTATVLAAAQLAVDATRRGHGEHVTSTTLGLELAAAIPLGGGAVRGLRAAEKVTHLVPGGGLAAHEGLDGGHTLVKHVGKTEDYLRHRLATEARLDAASTFYDREVAEESLSVVLHDNRKRIAGWLSASKRELVLIGHTPEAVGVVIYRDSDTVHEAGGIRLVLKRSSRLAIGYRIHTAMVTM